MCGINGVYDSNLSKTVAINHVQQMNNLIKHRGPDSGGIFFDKGFCLGHRRLSIIDISNSADQPMLSADGKLMIVFNGEIYKFITIRTRHWWYKSKFNFIHKTILKNSLKLRLRQI